MTLPSPQTPDELAKIESEVAEVTGLVGMVAGAASIFSAFRKPKTPPAAAPQVQAPTVPGANEPLNASNDNNVGENP